MLLFIQQKSAHTFSTRCSNCHTFTGFKQIIVNNSLMNLVLEDNIEAFPAYLKANTRDTSVGHRKVKTAHSTPRQLSWLELHKIKQQRVPKVLGRYRRGMF